jgi:hypothetical protein
MLAPLRVLATSLAQYPSLMPITPEQDCTLIHLGQAEAELASSGYASSRQSIGMQRPCIGVAGHHYPERR